VKHSWLAKLGVLLMCCPCAFSLNPSLDINQYAHNSWKISDGFSRGIISSIAQTPDGYLWLGTEFGLLRFDGVQRVRWDELTRERLPNSRISKLLVTRDGTLWIGTYKGLASWKDGKVREYPELAGVTVHTLLEDREGTLWAGVIAASKGKLCSIRSGDIVCQGEDGRFGRGVFSLCEYKGEVWAGVEGGLWRWKPGPPRFYPVPGPPATVNDLIEGESGALWIATLSGMRQFVDGRIEAIALPGLGQFDAYRLLRDREGGMWIATFGKGLVRVHQGRTDTFTSTDGLADDTVTSLFEDREGNIWASTHEGLDRFREFAVPTIHSKQGLSQPVHCVLAARDGSVWIGSGDGLNRWNHGQITVYRKPGGHGRERATPQPAVREVTDGGLPDNAVTSLFEDEHGRIWVSTRGGAAYFEDGRFVSAGPVPAKTANAIAEERGGDLWFADRILGLLHLADGKLLETVPWSGLKSQDYASILVADPLKGGLWLGFQQGDLGYFKDGRLRATYTPADGLGAGRVNRVRIEPDGTFWAATEGGLSRLKNGHIATLASRNGLPCDAVQWSMPDDAGALWLNMPCGLIRIAQPEWTAWTADPNRKVKVALFDGFDGVRSSSVASGYSPRVTKSTDGKIWFIVSSGVSVIDPQHLPSNGLLPPVHIEAIKLDGKEAASSEGFELSHTVKDVEIDYTALSLAIPERVRFKYKLEGEDTDWQDVGTRRQAYYHNLSPKKYSFRVIACNNDGVWNEAGATWNFTVVPAYYQTAWFRALCVAAVCALLWALYRYRLYQIKQDFNARLEERVGERTRIARELHDTLLQSFQGSLLVMQTARNLLFRRPEQAAETLDRAMSMATGAIGEGRDAIQDLRLQPAVESDLAQLLTATGQDLAHSGDANGNPVIFRVAVEGPRQDLDPIIQDEVYRIARELLRNAFRHARASQIEADIRYDDRLLRVLIRDDGKGIEREVVEAGGRAGHWGLLGMQERAKRIDARLEFWSEAGTGTEVVLSIPASIAYAAPRSGRFPLLRKKKANP
jgi:signal transduction histidine kinase/ligand-binding sensor domain-containing protein